MSIPYRPLGIIAKVIDQMGLEITYAYEDLVFICHNAFMLRMAEQGHVVHLYFNNDSDADARDLIRGQLKSLAIEQGLEIINSGTYTIKPRENDQLDIHFNEITHVKEQL